MKPQYLRILVTGMGGDFGQALAKALRLMDIQVIIVGTDAKHNSTANVFADKTYTLPLALDPTYKHRIADIVKRESIDAVVPGSEAEMLILSECLHHNNDFIGCPIICQPFNFYHKFSDKLLCFDHLEKNIALPRFADGNSEEAIRTFIEINNFPYVVKSRISSGSKLIGLAQTPAELKSLCAKIEMPVIQEFIDGSAGEFTLGIFATESNIHVIPFRRELGQIGASWYAETAYDQQDVLNYALDIARFTGMLGSFNIQVRKGTNGIGLLEINARFSSLVAARAIAGFRDLEWALKTSLNIPYSIPDKYASIRFQRYLHELIDFGNGYTAIPQWLPKS